MTSTPALLESPDQRKENVMIKKTLSLAALAGSLLLAAPAFADGYRGDRHFNKGDHRFHGRTVVVQQRAPYYAQRRVIVQRPAVVHRPVVVRQQPVVVYRQSNSHDVLGGLIVGAVLGAVIANHAGY
jgi:uncharacterized protein YcfJ